MLLTSGIVVVDGLFVGRVVGAEALAAVSLSLPAFYLVFGACMLTSVGFSSLASIALGAGEAKLASRQLSTALIAVIAVIGSIVASMALFFEPLCAFLSPDAGLRGLVAEYLGAMLPAYAFLSLNILFQVFARAEAKPMAALGFGLAANAANAFLDWLFIAQLGLGLRGAAYASGIAALLGAVMGLARIASGRSAFKIVRQAIPLREAAKALANGLSSAIEGWSTCIALFFYNMAFLSLLGAQGIAALTVFGYANMFQSMAVTGLCIGMAPLAGMSLGAGRPLDALRYGRMALGSALAVSGAAALAVAILGGSIASAFSGSHEGVSEIAAAGFAIGALAFMPGAFNAVASAFLTAARDAAGSGIIASLRALALPVACSLLLPGVLGVNGLWMIFPVAEIGAFAYAITRSRSVSRGLARGAVEGGLVREATA
jgi:Na+-driven multidrug efflux pump